MNFARLYHKIISFTLFACTYFCSNAQDDILKVASSLDKLPGKVVVYYPKGFNEQALYTQNFIAKAVDFYKAKLDVDIPISVALFGPEEYKQFTTNAWGQPGQYNQFLPFVASGPPAVMCLPVASGSALESAIQEDIKQNAAGGISSTEISSYLISRIGIHELGHVIMNELELDQGAGWYNEFMASYIAQAFIEQWPTKIKPAVASNDQSTAGKLYNKHFGGMFNGSSDNYIWWQSSLQKRVNEMFPTPGLSFIRQMANLRNSQQYFDDLTMLVAMEQVSPGFLDWAKRQQHINDQDNTELTIIQNRIKHQVNEALTARKYLYTSMYSFAWEQGDVSKADIVMKFMKGLENKSIDTSLLSPWIYYKNNWEKKADIVTRLMKDRNDFKQWKISVSSIIPVKSTDRNEDWIIVYGTVNKKDLSDKPSTINFTQWYKINKQNTIEFFKEFVE